MFKNNIKDTRTTPLAPCSSVFIVKFEQVNAGWLSHRNDSNTSRISYHVEAFKKTKFSILYYNKVM